MYLRDAKLLKHFQERMIFPRSCILFHFISNSDFYLHYCYLFLHSSVCTEIYFSKIQLLYAIVFFPYIYFMPDWIQTLLTNNPYASIDGMDFSGNLHGASG